VDIALSLKAVRAKAADILRSAPPEATRALEQVRDLARSVGKSREVARDARKTQAHAEVLRLREQFALIKKLYAGNPQEMARQMAKMSKELKAAVKSYAEATRGDPVASAEVVAAKTDARTATSADEATQKDAAASARDAANAYQKQGIAEEWRMRVQRDQEAQGTLEFVAQVRGLMKEMLKAFAEAKIKAAFLGKGRDERSEPFKEADAAMKDLGEAVRDLEVDARGDLLPAGLKVSATA